MGVQACGRSQLLAPYGGSAHQHPRHQQPLSPLVQMRLREVQSPVPGHIASERQRWGELRPMMSRSVPTTPV